MCWSTGREPMAQPPGSDTRAWPKRASSGPSARMDARMVFTSSYGASGALMRLASSVTMSGRSVLRSATTPMLRSSLSMVATSCSCGTLCSVVAVDQQRGAQLGQGRVLGTGNRHRAIEAAAAADEEFVHEGCLCAGGRSRIRGPGRVAGRQNGHPLRAAAGVSVGVVRGSRSGRPFRRGERLHRQRVDLLPHSIAQGGVDPLVAAHARQALELGRDDGGEEVPAVAFDVQVLARQAGGNVAAHLVGSGI
jgi:hypothetical protein